MPNLRDLCFAFLLNDFHNEYTNGICRGALQAAGELGISVIFFGVGALQSPVLNTAMRNRLFEIINPADFQGIIYISSSISNYVGARSFLEFTKMYGDIPCAHIGIESPLHLSLNIDNGKGMYAVV
jgi:DNA-binding LacI/PurR family transcriptional regulator